MACDRGLDAMVATEKWKWMELTLTEEMGEYVTDCGAYDCLIFCVV